jgi:hypothetical protein
MVGPLRRELTDGDATRILEWVAQGGRLVLIDREPHAHLAVTTSAWNVSVKTRDDLALFNADPANQTQMTAETVSAKPVQPTVFTNGVNAVQPSRFASAVNFSHFLSTGPPRTNVEGRDPHLTDSGLYDDTDEHEQDFTTDEPWFGAPVAHIAGGDRNLLVDVPYGSGQIVFLADPYIVANGGIALADNAKLAVNIVSTADGTIAFDEYHHGHGSNNNQLFAYFEGTPVTAIFLQIFMVAALVLISQSRRFARPVPEPEPSRLSKLEYVEAMAELQQRTKAYDLAIENIYTDFRRRAARSLGVDASLTSKREFAIRIAERAKLEPVEIEQLMTECEDIIHGEPTGKKKFLRIAVRIREIEAALGLMRAERHKF